MGRRESLSFHSGFSVSDTHPHPRIVYQHQQMTDKGTAQLQTGPHQDCVCVCVSVLYMLEWLTQVLTHTIMPCQCFARSADPHTVMIRRCSVSIQHSTVEPAAS